MVTVNATPGERILLGRAGENLAREVIFSLKNFQDLYGDGYPQLIVQRPGESTSYPVIVDVDRCSATWKVTNTDTQHSGAGGKVELRWYVGETLAKSAIWSTVVLPALQDPGGSPPETFQSWMDEMLQVATKAAASESQAKSAAASADRDASDAKLSATAACQSAQSAKEAADRIAVIRVNNETLCFEEAKHG